MWQPFSHRVYVNLLFLSMWFSFSDGLHCVKYLGILMKRNKLQDKVVQAENKINKKGSSEDKVNNSSSYNSGPSYNSRTANVMRIICKLGS